MKASDYSSVKQACRLLFSLWRLSTPASCSRLLCCVGTGSFTSPNCSCFFWPQRPKWESQGNDSLVKSMFSPQDRQFRDTVTFRSCYPKQNWIQNLKGTHTPYTHAPYEPCFLSNMLYSLPRYVHTINSQDLGGRKLVLLIRVNQSSLWVILTYSYCTNSHNSEETGAWKKLESKREHWSLALELLSNFSEEFYSCQQFFKRAT